MSAELVKRLKSLPAPTVINIDDFNIHLAGWIVAAKEVLGEDWNPLEADPYMKLLRVATLRDIHNRADKNETIKQLLVTTATGTDLDHLGAERDVLRDMGEKPTALVEFFLSREMPFDVIIPSGMVLNNTQLYDGNDVTTATVIEQMLIKKGQLSNTTTVALDSYVEQSDIKCEKIVTTVPYVSKVHQLSRFENGYALESDSRYRVRIIQSYAKYSTAGCVDAYEFYTRQADSRIDDVHISANEGVVSIVVHSFSSTDETMLERVTKAVNAKSVRPISDDPQVRLAVPIDVSITLNVELYDLKEQSITEQQIRQNFDNAMYIGQDLVRSDVMRKAHLSNVYRVNSDFTDVLASTDKVINIVEINFSFSGVSQ
jgi:phage-related baseplate assembly protein